MGHMVRVISHESYREVLYGYEDLVVKMVSEEVNPFGIPKLFIFGTVASGLVFGVVVGLTLIICKHKKVYYHSLARVRRHLKF